MLIAVIEAKNQVKLIEQYERLPEGVGAVELRLDRLKLLNKQSVNEIRGRIKKPMVFTLRRVIDGGGYAGSESDRLAQLWDLLDLCPEYVDIEHDVPPGWIARVRAAYPAIQIIRSYHCFEKTPENLDEILAQMRETLCDVYKIATYANSSLDVLRMLHFAKRHDQLVAHCMGELGVPSRVLGAVVGNYWHYGAADQLVSSVPGILSVKDLLETYRIKSLNAETMIYGLLGDPVSYSIGHQFHNAAFGRMGVNAVYVKFKVRPEELGEFFQLLQGFNVAGFSVTMPLKEVVLDYLDVTDERVKRVGAANTIRIAHDGLISGYNTDGVGALDAIEDEGSVARKKLLLIGAGGAAKAIADEAVRRGAELTIVNRTTDKALALADRLKCQGYGLDQSQAWVRQDYDFIINTVSGMAADNGILDCLSGQSTVMDIAFNAAQGPLLSKARVLGCQVISGTAMFNNQARLQLELWAAMIFLKLNTSISVSYVVD